MWRTCTLVGVLELALFAACSGLPSAYADPSDLCCNLPNHAQCSGCLDDYLVGAGELYACQVASTSPGCDIERKVCHDIVGPVPRYRDSSSCTIVEEWAQHVQIMMDGCTQTNCD